MTRRDNSSRTDASRSRLRNASISSQPVHAEKVWSAAIGASLPTASPAMKLALMPARWDRLAVRLLAGTALVSGCCRLFPKETQATCHRERSHYRKKCITNVGFNAFKEPLDQMSHHNASQTLRRLRRSGSTRRIGRDLGNNAETCREFRHTVGWSASPSPGKFGTQILTYG
jgi:hypothetical protein